MSRANVSCFDSFDVSPPCRQYQKGAIIFKKEVSQAIIDRVLAIPLLQKMLKRQIWSLEHGNYNKAGGSELFAMFDILKIDGLWLFKNKRPNILKQISHICFENMSKLMVNDNSIVSIQQLCYLNAPHLEGISLSGNYIASVKSLRKGLFPNLNFLGLQKNRILQLEEFEQISFSRGYSILLEQNPLDAAEGQDIRWIFKLESVQFQDLWIKSSKRILQERLLGMASILFKNCTIVSSTS